MIGLFGFRGAVLEETINGYWRRVHCGGAVSISGGLAGSLKDFVSVEVMNLRGAGSDVVIVRC